MNKKSKLILTAVGILGIVIILFVVFGKKTEPPVKEEVSIYFSKMVGADIVSESVKRKLPEGEDMITFSIAELIQGPTEEEQDQGFYSEIPLGTRVIDIKDTPHQVRINLNKQFVSGGGSNSIVARLKEVSNTALDAEPVRKVYLDIDGTQLDVIGGEGLEVVQPLVRDNIPPEDKKNK